MGRIEKTQLAQSIPMKMDIDKSFFEVQEISEVRGKVYTNINRIIDYSKLFKQLQNNFSNRFLRVICLKSGIMKLETLEGTSLKMTILTSHESLMKIIKTFFV